MFIDPRHPVRSFLRGCLFLSVAATLALMAWTLRQEGGAQHCVPGGGEIFGICRPTGDFLLNGLIWFALILIALAMPLGSILVLRFLRRPKN